MQILASSSLENSKGFNGKLVLPNEDENKKPDKVFLNIKVGIDENAKDIFNNLKGTEKCITFSKENPTAFCPKELHGKVFNECDLDILENDVNFPMPEGVITLVRIPDSYKDMRHLVEVCSKYPTVRVIGGTLLNVEGIRIGRFDTGKDKMSPVYKDIYDTFVEVDLDDLEGLQEIVSKTRKKAESLEGSEKKKKGKSKKSSAPKEKKAPKRVEVFGKLFGDAEEVAF